MFERNTTVKSETHDNKKGFRIIIKNLDNGEEVVNSVTKAIIGAYAGENQRGGEANGIVVTSCNTSTLIGTIEAADKAISETKKKVIEGLPPEVLLAALLSGGSRE